MPEPGRDEKLMLAFAGGDLDAFEEIVRRHELSLYNFFYRLVWERGTAEDLCQEVFMRLVTQAPNYEPRAKLSTYLYRIARSCWVDWLRQTKMARRMQSLDALGEGGQPLAERVAKRVEEPVDAVRKDEFIGALIGSIDALPEELKLVFILSEVRGMRYAEIAETLEIPEGTVKSRMFNALRRIRAGVEALRVRESGRDET